MCLTSATTGMMRLVQDFASKRSSLEEAIRLAHAAGDPFLACQTRIGMGMLFNSEGDHAGAEPWLLEALALAREIDDRWSTFDALNGIANNYLEWNRLREAKRYYGEALHLALDSGVQGFIHWCIGGFDYIAQTEGRMERAALLRATAVRLVVGDIEYKDVRDSSPYSLVIDEAADRKRWAVARTMTLDEIVDYALSDRD